MEPSKSIDLQDGTFYWLLIQPNVIPPVVRQRTYEEQRALILSPPIYGNILEKQNRQNLQDFAGRVQASRETSVEKNTDETGTDMEAVD